MTTMPAAEPMTADEFLALPLDDDGYGYAPCLVDGELVVTKPTVEHQETVRRLYHSLGDWIASDSDRGYVIHEIEILIDDLNVYEPDLLWYAEGRRPGRHDLAPYPMPDLAVEVRSPSRRRYDVGPKKAGYERRGLPELWLVDPRVREVLVFRRSRPDAPRFDVSIELGTGDVLESPLLAGFALPLDALFAD